MSNKRAISRRAFLGKGSKSAAGFFSGLVDSIKETRSVIQELRQPVLQLGLRSDEASADWDIATLIRHGMSAGFQGVEGMIGANGIELEMSDRSVGEIKLRLENTAISWLGLHSGVSVLASEDTIGSHVLERIKRVADLAQRLGESGITVGFRLGGTVSESVSEHIKILTGISREMNCRLRVELEGLWAAQLDFLSVMSSQGSGNPDWRIRLNPDFTIQNGAIPNWLDVSAMGAASLIDGLAPIAVFNPRTVEVLVQNHYNGWLMAGIPVGTTDRLAHLDHMSGHFEDVLIKGGVDLT